MTCVSHIKGSRCGGTVGGGDDGGYQRNDLILQEIASSATLCYIVELHFWYFVVLHCGGDKGGYQRNDLILQEIASSATFVLHCGTTLG